MGHMPHRCLQQVCCALIAVAVAGAAPPPRSNAAAERLKAVKADVAAAKDAFYGAWKKQPEPWPMSAGVAGLNEAYDQKRKAGRDEAFAIATADPASRVGFEALEYVLGDAQLSADPTGKTAMELMAKYHARNPRVGKAVGLLGYFAPPPRAAS
jgi:hypothetical protein